jgi:hypothetical protein
MPPLFISWRSCIRNSEQHSFSHFSNVRQGAYGETTRSAQYLGPVTPVLVMSSTPWNCEQTATASDFDIKALGPLSPYSTMHSLELSLALK